MALHYHQPTAAAGHAIQEGSGELVIAKRAVARAPASSCSPVDDAHLGYALTEPDAPAFTHHSANLKVGCGSVYLIHEGPLLSLSNFQPKEKKTCVLLKRLFCRSR